MIITTYHGNKVSGLSASSLLMTVETRQLETVRARRLETGSAPRVSIASPSLIRHVPLSCGCIMCSMLASIRHLDETAGLLKPTRLELPIGCLSLLNVRCGSASIERLHRCQFEDIPHWSPLS
jgi:hypothetical protein